MADLELLLRDYGDEMDDECPAVTVDEILDRVESGPTTGSRPSWRLAVAAAVLLVVGVAVALAALRNEPGSSVRVDQPPAPLDSTPPAVPVDVELDTWSVAARFSEVDLEALRERETAWATIEEVADMLTEELDTVEVRVIEADAASWTAAMGDDGEAFGCDPTCLPGIVIWTEGFGDLHLLDGSEAVAHWMVSNWAVGLPAEQVMMSATAQAEAWVVAEDRSVKARRDLDAYLASIGASAPEPRFDLSPLGIEQLVAPAPEASRPVDDPIWAAVLSDDTLADPFHATATPNGVIGYVFHPELSEATDLAEFLDPLVVSMLGVAAPDESTTGYEFWLHRAGVETISASSGGSSDEDTFVATRRWIDGVAALGAGLLPPEVVVVATELPDGTAVWQRPVQRMVIFIGPSPPGFDDHDGPEWTWQARLVGYDADGARIFVAVS